MKVAFVLSANLIAFALSASVFGQSPNHAQSLTIQLSQEFLDAGWLIRVEESPATTGLGTAKMEIPGQGAVQQIFLENKSLGRDVTLKDGSRKQVHSKITLAVYPRDRMAKLLSAWDAAYEAKLKSYREIVENHPETAIAPPTSPDTFLFWQTSDYVLLLFEDEIGFPETTSVKLAVKRQLVGQ